MQQMRAGVIRLDLSSSLRVDSSGQRIARSDCASIDLDPVDVKSGDRRVGILDDCKGGIGFQSTSVADLSAGLGIKRCAIQQSFAALTLSERVDLLVSADQCNDLCAGG